MGNREMMDRDGDLKIVMPAEKIGEDDFGWVDVAYTISQTSTHNIQKRHNDSVPIRFINDTSSGP